MLKTLDFPIKPHVRKYLNTHLGPDIYVLSNADRFGKMLYHLLRRQVKGKLHHAGSREDCTARLQLDLRNFPAHQYGLKEVTDYTIFQFNDFCDEILKEELYLWVRQFVNKRTTIREVILDFMGAYDIREEDIQYETLRKAVQRNCNLTELKKRKPKSVVKMSQKTGGLSRDSADLSQKTGDLSRAGQHRVVRQELTQMPGTLTDFIRQRHGAVC
ncbi:hypothetical protein [Hymenobacter psychrotolerans]|uniref:Uncharacterized protein n=1 Tax=Hymenobacter psychrotolerans DSM 18569 TaxID=1121959 RepID=A0A1M7E6B0_9BACT|nr:hypothetical protein [Hymenobacter psychrotolerans]SHL87263.1 hypothetical protein SAMN02746009_03530 [Hymenobacter psychrotolerans DSM 18569]